MTTPKFTPGPWAKMAQDIYSPAIAGDNNTGMVCAITMCDEWEANARLIAAAPEMYRLIERLMDVESPIADLADAMKTARALLSRIDGTDHA